MCLKCYGVVKSGIIHLCSDVQAVKNLVNAAYALGSASAECVASSILKTKMEKENIFRGEKFTIATHGKPLTIVIELMKYLELSQCKTKKCVLYLEKVLAFKVALKEILLKN